MRIRIGIIMAYLLLGCILLEVALPYIAKSNRMEMCERKKESVEKDGKKEKELEDECKEVKEKFRAARFHSFSFLTHPGSLFADSEKIPDSAHQSIFSPPPNWV